MAQRLPGGALLEPSERADRGRRRSTTPSATLRGAFDSRQRRLGRRAEVPGGVGDRVPAAPRRAPDGAADAALDGLRRHLRPGRRRLRALRVDAPWTVPHFEKMLYDNALLARAYLHGWQVTRRRAAAAHRARRRSTGRCARCARRRAASTARSTPTPRASRASSTCGRSTSCAPRSATTPTPRSPGSARPSAGNFEGANILESRGPEPPAEVRERIRARAARRARRARAPGPRRQAPDRLERADDRGAGRRRRGARARRLPRRRARRAARFVLERDARRPTGACCAPSTRARRGSTPTSRTTRSCSRRCSTLYEATFEERWFAAARELADTIVDRFADPERRRLLLDLRRPRGARRAAQGPRGRPDPVGRLGAAFGLLRLAALTGEARYEDARRVARCASLHEIAPRHPTAFGHLLQALDFHLAPVREVALAGEPAGVAALARVVRGPRSARTSCSRAARATAARRCRCWRAARRSTGARRPTSASTSPACGR